ncbi:hypothetical protein MRX96_025116 [Rhipicephalus microplus]
MMFRVHVLGDRMNTKTESLICRYILRSWRSILRPLSRRVSALRPPLDADLEAAASADVHLRKRVPALTQWPPCVASGETPSGRRSIRRRARPSATRALGHAARFAPPLRS